MKMKLLSLMSLIFALFVVTASLTVDVAAQKGKGEGSKKTNPIALRSSRGGGGRGAAADPNIKKGEATNDANAKMGAPAAKGGKSRGGGDCRIELDNRTQWLIGIYVDGDYRGSMDSYGDSYLYVGAGNHTVYARANFTDGSFLYWGPRSYEYCYNGVIYFTMNP